jgi:hypothetical protein
MDIIASEQTEIKEIKKRGRPRKSDDEKEIVRKAYLKTYFKKNQDGIQLREKTLRQKKSLLLKILKK